jgi:hypothetical protein
MPEVQSYEESCEFTGRDPKLLPDVSKLPEKEARYILACYMIPNIIHTLNDGKEIDWTDNSPKYNLLYYFGSGSGFSCCDFANWHSCSDVGPRFAFIKKERGIFFFRQFKSLIADWLMMDTDPEG